jgi:hypothetical protein
MSPHPTPVGPVARRLAQEGCAGPDAAHVARHDPISGNLTAPPADGPPGMRNPLPPYPTPNCSRQRLYPTEHARPAQCAGSSPGQGAKQKGTHRTRRSAAFGSSIHRAGVTAVSASVLGGSAFDGVAAQARVGGTHSWSSCCPLLGRGEPLSRRDRCVVVECLVRPFCVVLDDPGIDRGLGGLDRGERTAVIEQLAAERQMEPLDLPVVVGEAGWVSRWVMPFLRQILSNSTSPPFPNRSVNCFPLSVNTSSGTPNRCRA